MVKKINKIKLFIKNNSFSMIIANSLKDKLLKNNFKIVDNDYDLAIAIGGDGTFLKMIQENNFNNKIIYVGINSGNLGFFEDINIDELDIFVKCIKKNDFILKNMSYLNVEIICNKKIKNFHSLNEVVVRNANYKTLSSSVYIDDVLLENYFGDGVLISTSIGSTAYNLSVGGPIIYDSLHNVILTPIAPINNHSYKTLRNSLVIPNNKKIEIVPNKDIKPLIIVDGKEINFDCIDRIKVSINKNKIKYIRLKDHNFEKLINEKIIC